MLKDRLEQLINNNVKDKLFPACAVGAITPSAKVAVCGGTYTYADGRPITPGSVFDAASLTKALPTACSALKLLEEHRLKLNDDIRRFLPEYKNEVTVWNLLTQTVYYDFGFPLSSLSHMPPDEIIRAIFEAPVKTYKDEYHYTNSSSILLGLVVEKITGKSLPALGREMFFEPLGMERTGFEPLSLAKKAEIVPTEVDKSGSTVHSVVHDESARAFGPRAVGSAGLFTTVEDLLKFTGMLLNHGQSGGRRLFSQKTIDLMGTNQLQGDESVGLGWELSQPRYMGKYAAGTFGKTGFTGCVILVNLKLGSSVVILSNHIHPKRPANFEAINNFRRQAADLVFGSAVS